MKKILQLSGFLSWFNLVCGCLLVLGGLLMVMVTPDILVILTSVVLTSAIVLHSYASIQLRKTVLHPEIPLSRSTPGGIRFMGFIALFFAIWNFTNALVGLQNAPEIASKMELPAQYRELHLNLTAIVRASGIFQLVISICIMINVVISMRILRWFLASVQDPTE